MIDDRQMARMATVEGNFRIIRPKVSLAFTGERMTSAVEGQIEFEHLHRYCFARDLCSGLDVVDVASGEGYGSAMLAGVARSVVGIEIDTQSVQHAREAYSLPNLRFEQGDAHQIPLSDASVDVVVSFETIEHLDDPRAFLAEVRRVLRPGGFVVVSTPERTIYSAPGSDVNPYHRLEYTEAEFSSELRRYFERIEMIRQRPLLGSTMVPVENQAGPARTYERRSQDIVEASAGLARAPYVIAVAGNGDLPAIGVSNYVDRRNVHRVCEDLARIPALESHIAEIERELADQRMVTEKTTATLINDLELRLEQFRSGAASDRSALAAALDSARKELDSAAQREAALTYDVEELRATLVRLDNADVRAAAAQAETQRLREELERERDAAVRRRGRLAEELETALRTAHSEIERREQALNDYRHALETERAQTMQLSAHLAGLHASMSWKLLAPVRVIARRMPRTARSGRRAAKLLWWTATLQLGTRIYERRLYRRQLAQEQAAASLIESSTAPADRPLLDAPQIIDTPGAERSQALLTSLAHVAQEESQSLHFPRATRPRVSVIIPVYGKPEELLACLRSVAATVGSEPSFEVIVADDRPDERATTGVLRSPGLRVLDNPTNLGFLRTCNRAAARAEGEFLLFLNSDTLVAPGWLSALVSAMDDDPRVGLAGSMLLNTDGTIQDAGWRIGGDGWGIALGRGRAISDSAHNFRREADCVTGASLLVRRVVFEALGGFDDAYAPAFYEEFDLAFRARARGWRTVFEPASKVVHLGSSSYGAAERDRLSSRNHATFTVRFADRLRRQPWADAPEFLLSRAVDTGPVILVVDDKLPQPDRHAGGVTLCQYLGIMAAAGWRVTFAPHDGITEVPMADSLRRMGIEVLPGGPGAVAAWLRTNGRHLDYAWVARPGVAPSVLPALRDYSSALVAYYTHDLHHHRLRQEAILGGSETSAVAEADAMEELELEIIRLVDCVMSCSDVESNMIRRLAPATRVVTVPAYYVENQAVIPRSAERFGELNDIVFVGGFPHIPNVDAALFIARDIMPLIWQRVPDARLLLVGYGPPPEVLALANDRIVVTGQVPDLAPYFLNARLSLVALRYGAGVKGKVVQALQFGTPVVTTSVGAEGLDLTSGDHVLIADDAQGLADLAISLLLDPKRAADLGVAGLDFIRGKLSRAAMRHALNDVYRPECCPVCGSTRLTKLDAPPTGREGFACYNCFSLVRSSALAALILQRYAANGSASLAELSRSKGLPKMLEIGFAGAIAETLRGDASFQDCEYFDQVIIGGRGPDGIRSEDVMRLTFAEESFDLVISQEVMEHVPDPRRGFEEMRRVLRPGGRLLFTIPVNWEHAANVTRATIENGRVRHRMDPEYHGDPIREAGALVFTDWGSDALDFVADCGFEVQVRQMEVPGTSLIADVFEAVKTQAALPSVKAMAAIS